MSDIDSLRVGESIQCVIDRFKIHPNVFLTEDDVRVHLCRELLAHHDSPTLTRDQDYSIPLHTEVRWYGSDGSLKLRSDIVLLDVADLEVKRSLTMPSKGYGFNIPKAIIEIKFRRPNGPSDNRFRQSIENDLIKLHNLRRIFSEAAGGSVVTLWLLALDKKSQLTDFPSAPEGVMMNYEFSSVRHMAQPTV